MELKFILGWLFLRAVTGCLTAEEKNTRLQMKYYIFGGLTEQRSQNIAAGIENPFFAYEWNVVMLIHWEIKDVKGLRNVLDLPPDLSLAPIHLFEKDKHAKYYLSVLIKRMSTGGPQDIDYYQADWMTYVTSPDNMEPVMLILETVAKKDLYTANGFLSASSKFDVSVDKKSSYSVVIDEPNTKLTVSIANLKKSHERCALHSDYIHAFYRVYWTNGVYSQLFINGSLSKSHPVKQHSSEKTIMEATRWSPFIKKEHSLITIDNCIQVGEEVWVNAEKADSSDVQYLTTTKTEVFSAMTMQEYNDINNGLREPLAFFLVQGDVIPAYYINFHVRDDKLQDLANILPKGFQLSPIQVRKHGPREYIIAVNVYLSSGIAPGYRVEWSTFVIAPGSNAPSFMVLDVTSSTSSLDPVNMFTQPSDVFLMELGQDGMLRTDIQKMRGIPTFSASFPCSFDCSKKKQCDTVTDEFQWTNDKVYWTNGMFDVGLYDSHQLQGKVVLVNKNKVVVNDGTAWADYVDGIVEVLLIPRQEFFLLKPWNNLEEIELCA